MDWILSYAPGVGILIFFAWCLWKSYWWVNNKFMQIDIKFAQIDTRFAQIDTKFAQIDVRFTQIDVRFTQLEGRMTNVEHRLTNVEQRLTNVEGDVKNLIVGQHKLETQLAVLDMKIDQKFEAMNQRFDAQDKFNEKLLLLLDPSLKNNSSSIANPDLQQRVLNLEQKYMSK
jgi:chromosome segregation ATPase